MKYVVVKSGRKELGALWMRAVANACGYTPEVAKPLGLAYSLAQTRGTEYRRHLRGDLHFGGMTFEEPEEGTICVMGRTFQAKDYDSIVHPGFPSFDDHNELLYIAIESADTHTLTRLDTTGIAWKLMKAAMGLRTGFTVEDALHILKSSTNR